MFGKPDPNICISVYKNRGGKYNNVKIWLYIDYSTMRVDDLFVTDNDYQILEIAKTYTGIIEDGSIIIANSREELTQMLKEREMAQDILDDGSSNALEELGESLELEENEVDEEDDNNESINHFVELEEPEDEKVPEEEEETDSEEENIETLSIEPSEDDFGNEEVEDEFEEDEYENESELVGFDDIPEIEDEGDNIPEIEDEDDTSEVEYTENNISEDEDFEDIEEEKEDDQADEPIKETIDEPIKETIDEPIKESIKQVSQITPKKQDSFGDGWDDDW